MSDPYRTPAGEHVALANDEPRRLRRLQPGEEPPPGWHLMTRAEFEREIDLIVEDAASVQFGDTAPSRWTSAEAADTKEER
jgi:hypothetical protein